MRVLIADDEPGICEFIEEILQSSAYTTVVVSDGDDAWKILHEDRSIRLAILDWVMPGLSGVSIAKRLLEQLRGRFVYTILLTGRSGPEDIAHALAEGASDYIVKPFQRTELLARVEVGRRLIELQGKPANAQKMEAVGRLAAGLAHEINSP